MVNLKTPLQILAVDTCQKLQGDATFTMDTSPTNEGSFTYQSNFDGLSVHYCDVVESKPLTITEQLPAGLSIDLILNGGISFELENQQYTLKSDPSDLACSVCVFSRPSSFKLYLQQDLRIKKVNIFAELSWFKKRFANQVQLSLLNQLFTTHAQVGGLVVSSEMLSVISALAAIAAKQDVRQDTVLKEKAIQFLALCVQQFLSTDCGVFSNKPTQSSSSSLSEQVSQLIANESAGQAVSLQDIANHVNLSISTLQRRFKSVFGMTVIEYARTERLEKAKRALVDEGLSIGEAAYLSGYQHASSFVSAFTKHFDISPSRYKNTQKLVP
ncbi:helix-turn-helix domain-containing protein [Leucothrix arctica]|uniref:HTH araC/xylS-type domain-containing protein n=1 Tax=Leucothrix arctica TaxID=1481894 RepID=A0A317C9E1_9GAMM|nr:helix-turn-helix transcriptional regulator [Leucothrix arctica]PWQ95166.1 hypothetical protein DKT75_12515 [Leucothrix arctica]